MLFIEGARAAATENFQNSIQDQYTSRNFMLRILAYQAFFASNIGSLENIDCEEFVRYILQTAQDTKFKKETIAYLDNLAKEVFGLTR